MPNRRTTPLNHYTPPVRDLDWSDVEADADRMRQEHDDAAYEAWAAEHADEINRQAYVDWCKREGRSARMDENFDNAWLTYLDSLIPDDPW